jgi:GntR family transcriptional regulator, rspAB operon transcriptional repressor
MTRDGQHVAVVHAQLRDAILRAELVPGAELSQVELARTFDTGRTPLREAIRLLQHEGLVIVEPNRRVRISDLSVADVEELYSARIALETTAARVTTPQLTAVDVAELQGFMAQMRHLAATPSAPLPPFAEAHRAFHRKFVAHAGPRTAAIIDQLFDHAERYRRVYGAAAPDHYARRDAEHQAMLDAAAHADPEAVASAITVHYVRTAQLVVSAVSPMHSLDNLRTTVAAVAPGGLIAFS